MADLPMAQIPQFSLGATPTTANIGQGINEGLNQGYSSYLAQQQLAQKQQELAQKQQELQQENGKNIAQNALQAYDAYGDAAGPESFNAFKQGMNMMAPGSVDPNAQWDDSMGGALKTANDAFSAATDGKRPWPEAIGVISKTMSMASKNQQARMQPILQSAQDQFNQQQSTQRQQSSQTQDTQRAYAEHAQPLIQKGAVLQTISQLLNQNTPEGDAAAKVNIQQAISNGSLSQDEVNSLTTAGGPLEKMSQYFHTVGSGKTFDKEHRDFMNNWASAKTNELNNTLSSMATAFPGASPAHITTRKYSQSKSGKSIYSDDGGQSWQYQSR